MPLCACCTRLAPALRLATTRLARLRPGAVSQDARAARAIREPFSRLSAGSASLPGATRRLASNLPAAARFFAVCNAALCVPLAFLPCGVPHGAFPGHLAPALRRATMQPARLCCATMPQDARVARPIRKSLSRFSAGNALLPGCPPPPGALRARRPRRHGVCRAQRGPLRAARDLNLRHATSRALRASRSGLAACDVVVSRLRPAVVAQGARAARPTRKSC